MGEMKAQIIELTKSLGMDLCGIASVDRFAGAPEGTKPEDVLPGCKSVIVVGLKLLDGVVQANFRAFEEGKTNVKGIFATYGYTIVPNFELSYVCYSVARFIENNSSGIATPCSTGPMTNGKQISNRHAAVAAGLGEFGHMSIVINPEFGPRVRWGVILTTLELEADQMYDGPKLCEPEKCGVCARVCPTGAIRMPGTHELAHVEIGGKSYEYNLTQFVKCNKALKAMTKALGGAEDYLDKEDPTMEDMLEAEKKMPIDITGLQHINTWNCNKCQTYCPAGNWGKKYKETGLSKGASVMFMDEKV